MVMKEATTRENEMQYQHTIQIQEMTADQLSATEIAATNALIHDDAGFERDITLAQTILAVVEENKIRHGSTVNYKGEEGTVVSIADMAEPMAEVQFSAHTAILKLQELKA